MEATRARRGTETLMRDLEPRVTEFIRARLRPDMTFVDVGAYHGWYTLLAAPIVKQVLAFEPTPEYFATLHQNIAGLTNVRISPYALFSRSCFGTLKDGVRWDMFQAGKGSTVAWTLDSVIPPGRVDMIKIDTEGAELDILLGAKKLIGRYHPVLVIEPHWMMETYFDHPVAELEAFLRVNRYQWRGLDYEGDLYQALVVEKRGCHLVAW